ncbi:hypothetical protein LguiB_033938 [Lonicera macranthoides]
MGVGVLWFSMFFLFFLISGSSTAAKPHLDPIWQHERQYNQQNKIVSSETEFTSQLDATSGTIPIINPTTPTTTTPIVNPTMPPAATTPITNPTLPPPAATTMPPPATTTPTPATTTPASSGGSWCTASPTASENALQVALDYACGYGGADCSGIQPGAPCYSPTTLRDHASYAFNQYYKKNPAPTSCAFGGTAQLTHTDPSSGSCRYASSSSTSSTSPPLNPTPTSPSPPTTYGINPNPPTTSGNIPTAPTTYNTTPSAPATYGTTPGAPTTYGSIPTGFGSEPTGTPSSANSCNLMLLFMTTSLVVSLVAANYL